MSPSRARTLPRHKVPAMLRTALSAAVLTFCVNSVEAAGRPVVVELFTSEGCSSCPPADAFLTELSRSRPDVLPLAFHVTYWDQLGWKDPYGLAAATARQASYGARFGDGSYTPEMVVDGRKGLVGSERGEGEAAIRAAAAAQGAAPGISVQRRGGTVDVTVAAGRGAARVVLVGFDPQHRTAVGRGENSGRTLTESNIVRSVRTIGRWGGSPVTLSSPVPAGDDLAVLLEAEDGAIVGAARLGAAS